MEPENDNSGWGQWFALGLFFVFVFALSILMILAAGRARGA